MRRPKTHNKLSLISITVKPLTNAQCGVIRVDVNQRLQIAILDFEIAKRPQVKRVENRETMSRCMSVKLAQLGSQNGMPKSSLSQIQTSSNSFPNLQVRFRVSLSKMRYAAMLFLVELR